MLESTVSGVATMVGILVLAAIVESVVEYLFAPWFDTLRDRNEKLRTLILRYLAAIIGVGLAIAYEADLLALMGLSSGVPFVGSVLTGLLLGRGANYVHDFASRWLQSAD